MISFGKKISESTTNTLTTTYKIIFSPIKVDISVFEPVKLVWSFPRASLCNNSAQKHTNSLISNIRFMTMNNISPPIIFFFLKVDQEVEKMDWLQRPQSAKTRAISSEKLLNPINT